MRVVKISKLHPVDPLTPALSLRDRVFLDSHYLASSQLPSGTIPDRITAVGSDRRKHPGNLCKNHERLPASGNPQAWRWIARL